jgi:hypothetical protein
MVIFNFTGTTTWLDHPPLKQKQETKQVNYIFVIKLHKVIIFDDRNIEKSAL